MLAGPSPDLPAEVCATYSPFRVRTNAYRLRGHCTRLFIDQTFRAEDTPSRCIRSNCSTTGAMSVAPSNYNANIGGPIVARPISEFRFMCCWSHRFVALST